MQFPRRRFLHLAAGTAVLPSVSRLAAAQAYPTRPITMIVPYAAGGPTDTVGRVVTERMRPEVGQPIIAENVTGAGGSIGLGRLARATPDGYTIDVGNWSAHVVNGAIYNLAYDLRTDFAPIALLAQAPQIVLSRKDLPASDLKGLIAWMKANRGKVTIGTAGVGTPPHICAAFFLNLTGTEAQLVPYRGGLPAVQDLVAGQLDITISDTISSVPQVRAGTVMAYAITGSARIAALPDVPSADEADLPGFHVSTWNALFAPKRAASDHRQT
jgi:tripartite-type tricarboxylate transporter receptor subunit TctC